jgi:regulator of protease activity HflC (stomatin/prohibitin superfamily)
MSEDLKKSHGDKCEHPHRHHHHYQHHNGGDIDVGQEGFDPANQALAEALRISFIILKLVIVCVVAGFIYSGMFKVKQNERAVVLRFGKVEGYGSSKAILNPGWHWAWPYPIEEVIKVPAAGVERQLNIDSFWYYRTEIEKATNQVGMGGKTLQFVRDGYSLTASRSVTDMGGETEAGSIDYNLAHSRWALLYSIVDPVSVLEKVWDGKESGWGKVETLLSNALADAVIVCSGNRDINWMIWEKPQQFGDEVQEELLNRLSELGMGIAVKVNLVEITTPRQVKDAFDQANSAELEAGKLKKDAGAKAEEILNNARAEADNLKANAEVYRSSVVNSAKADAKYLDEVLAKINLAVDERVARGQANYEAERKKAFDELLAVTVDQLYQEALREVISQSDEVIVPSVSDNAETEWRIYLSRDATLKPEKKGSE